MSLALAALAVLLALPAVVGLLRADDGLVLVDAEVDGVPLTFVEPDASAGDGGRPGVVVAHGFSGSRTLMLPLARGLARAGYAVVLLDFAGHGTSADGLPLDDDGAVAAEDRLAADLAVAVGALTARPGVDAERLTLLGHSMGAGAVVRYAVASGPSDDGPAATVAVSLPSDEDVPPGRPSMPRNLLLLVGAAESARFTDAALGALRAGYPDGEAEVTYGDAATGDARRLQVVPGVEHISIVLAPDTLAATLDWLAPVVDGPAGPGELDPTLRWLGLLTLAAAVGAVPLARWAYGRRPVPGPTGSVRWWVAALVALGSALVASVAAWALGPLERAVPLAVGGYVLAWFTVAGATAWVGVRLADRAGSGRPDRTAATRRERVATGVMTAYVVVTLALTGRATWSSWAWVGPRPWLALLLLVAFGCYFRADEALVARASGWRRAGLAALTRVIAVVVILGSVAVLGAPGFLVLLLPLMVLLFVLLGWYAAVVATRAASPWAPTLVQAVPIALLVATTFPLTA